MPRIEIFVIMAITFIFSTCILYIPILFMLKKKNREFIRQLSYLALLSSVFLIIFATILFVPILNSFTPFIFKLDSNLNLIPFGWLRESNPIKQIIGEVIPNIMMFIPLGFSIPVVFKKMRNLYKLALTICLFSFCVEFFQYFIGRSADVDDIITNFLGGIIGYGIFYVLNKLFKDKKWWNKFIENNLAI